MIDSTDGNKYYFYGTTDGDSAVYDNTMGGKSYCSKMFRVGACYDAICAIPSTGFSWYDGSCPKGWGKNKGRYPNGYYSVQKAQGHIADGTGPIYSTVTKYRDAVYNYITTRVAKA